ncbi:MAG: hypothetical protein EBV84_05735 [Betaproteobacteria bacterium]|nr:hypothetical protein [Betaproteobacteria bacterium]
MNRNWLKHYPQGVPSEIDPGQYSSLVQLLEEAFTRFRDRPAYIGFAKPMTYGELDDQSRALGAFLQAQGVEKGDRVAIMMPNVLQYPIALAAILRIGAVVVNVNPLYTPRELEHQLKDSGARAILILENFATTLQQVIRNTEIKLVVLASMGDMLGFKGKIVNFVVRRVKKMVPEFSLPGAHLFNDALNPRDLDALVKELRPHRFHMFPAVNTLYNALAGHPGFKELDFSSLRVSNGGGMAVQRATAERWLELTGCPICEGYGLSETSPSATCNPTDTDAYSGTIGMPLPSTEVVILDDDGRKLGIGERGEIAIRGPQVMVGYWNKPHETAKVMTPDGFFKSGDVGIMDERGYITIVDRKKDMILVSGFNVYPNEVESVVSMHPGVLECAAIGVPDGAAGEAVKLFVVKRDPALTEFALREYCAENLTGYKKPKIIEFRAELPKTNVGKILRRALRDGEKTA